ncbi:MAG TPA: hypothetical protein VF824_12535 [Thermoanaerobaculia bacterium]|jgi:hypothetical protein
MRKVMIAVCFFVSASAFAASMSDTYVVPVAGHVRGANGETWVTDVTLHNPNGAPLLVELSAVGANGAALDVDPAVVTLPARGTTTLRDVLHRASGLGALVAVADEAFALTSRVYTAGARGSVGQSVAAMNEFADAERPDAFLTGLASNDSYRTNIGFFAVADAAPLQIEVALFDANGATLGTRTFTIAAGTMTQLQVSSRDIAPVSFDAATARVRVVAGDGLVTSYASLVDNHSSDGSFIAASVVDGGAPLSLLRSRVVVR